MSYKSPIDVVMGAIQTEIENGTYKAVQEYGIFVDKDEMIKALKYDRGQYEEGYSKGCRIAKSEVVRCKDCKNYHEYKIKGNPTGWGKCEAIAMDIDLMANDYCSYGEREEQK